eukprot:TRINITY_DN124_c3_g1_i3.p1 TRINITY_DN124_c3_g1~~TRINITY_DN124_c3_g1_i3.p1  ORF type:complete len:1307 (+),score=326.28 TRINITY_DN124_c3_g1_i3:394-3921(+)
MTPAGAGRGRGLGGSFAVSQVSHESPSATGRGSSAGGLLGALRGGSGRGGPASPQRKLEGSMAGLSISVPPSTPGGRGGGRGLAQSLALASPAGRGGASQRTPSPAPSKASQGSASGALAAMLAKRHSSVAGSDAGGSSGQAGGGAAAAVSGRGSALAASLAAAGRGSQPGANSSFGPTPSIGPRGRGSGASALLASLRSRSQQSTASPKSDRGEGATPQQQPTAADAAPPPAEPDEGDGEGSGAAEAAPAPASVPVAEETADEVTAPVTSARSGHAEAPNRPGTPAPPPRPPVSGSTPETSRRPGYHPRVSTVTSYQVSEPTEDASAAEELSPRAGQRRAEQARAARERIERSEERVRLELLRDCAAESAEYREEAVTRWALLAEAEGRAQVSAAAAQGARKLAGVAAELRERWAAHNTERAAFIEREAQRRQHFAQDELETRADLQSEEADWRARAAGRAARRADDARRRQQEAAAAAAQHHAQLPSQQQQQRKPGGRHTDSAVSSGTDAERRPSRRRPGSRSRSLPTPVATDGHADASPRRLVSRGSVASKAEKQREARLLWREFVAALQRNGSSPAEIAHATEDQLQVLLTSELGFDLLDALRIINEWKRRKEEIQPPSADADPQQQRAAAEAAADAKGRRVWLDPAGCDFAMVNDVMRRSVTVRNAQWRVKRIGQLVPSATVAARYERARQRLSPEFRAPKVLYYAGVAMPPVVEVLHSGFGPELRRRRCLVFSTEATLDCHADPLSSEALPGLGPTPQPQSRQLLLCEVIPGCPHRVQGPLRSEEPGDLARRLHRIAHGVPSPRRHADDPPAADSLVIDYSFLGADGEARGVTKYAVADGDRVLPRYVAYLSVVPSPTAPCASVPYPQPMATTPTAASAAAAAAAAAASAVRSPPQSQPRISLRVPGSPAGRRRRFPSDSPLEDELSTELSLPPGSAARGEPVMCPYHPSQELRLFCVDNEELTCVECAAVGRHARRRCEPLADLLARMRAQFAVHEKSVSAQLTRCEAGLAQLRRQRNVVRDSEQRLRAQLSRRVDELSGEISRRREALESALRRKADEAEAQVRELLLQAQRQQRVLREARERLRALVDAPRGMGESDRGVSARAADIIVLSKLLERTKEQVDFEAAGGFADGIEFTRELEALRLPDNPVTSPLRESVHRQHRQIGW